MSRINLATPITSHFIYIRPNGSIRPSAALKMTKPDGVLYVHVDRIQEYLHQMKMEFGKTTQLYDANLSTKTLPVRVMRTPKSKRILFSMNRNGKGFRIVMTAKPYRGEYYDFSTIWDGFYAIKQVYSINMIEDMEKYRTIMRKENVHES